MAASLNKTGKICAVAVALTVSVAACSGDSGGAAPGDGNSDTSGGSPGATTISLEFAEPEGLTLTPRQERRIEVRVKPRGAHTVRFSLLAASPDATLPDAALDRSETVSEASGSASVTLTAPSTPSTVFLRAQVGRVTASLQIKVSTGAVATLDVRPLYAGNRKIVEWVASAHVGFRCSRFSPSFLEDGPYLARAPYGAPLQLLDVPTATELAVVVRAGHFVSGCATAEGVQTDARTSITVSVGDRPVSLAGTRLDILLGLPKGDAAFTAELDAERVLCADALRRGAEDDVAGLLDAMQDEAPLNIGGAFARARMSDDFYGVLRSGLGPRAGTHMLDAIARWSQIGQEFLLSSRALEGRLTAADPGKPPVFELVRLAQLSPQRMAASFASTAWSVDPSDTLTFSGSLSFSGSLLFTSLVEGPALAETGEAETSLALAKIVDCAKVADLLSAGVSEAGAAFAVECGLRCVEALCQAGIWDMWQRARNASGSVQHKLLVSAAGRAQVGAFSEAVGVEGSWVGKLSGNQPTADSGGTFRGFLPR